MLCFDRNVHEVDRSHPTGICNKCKKEGGVGREEGLKVTRLHTGHTKLSDNNKRS